MAEGDCVRLSARNPNSADELMKTGVGPERVEIWLDSQKRHARRSLRHRLIQKSHRLLSLPQTEMGQSEINRRHIFLFRYVAQLGDRRFCVGTSPGDTIRMCKSGHI